MYYFVFISEDDDKDPYECVFRDAGRYGRQNAIDVARSEASGQGRPFVMVIEHEWDDPVEAWELGKVVEY